jgi:hypothetical protein
MFYDRLEVLLILFIVFMQFNKLSILFRWKANSKLNL